MWGEPKQVSREVIDAETRGLQERLVEIAQELKDNPGDYRRQELVSEAQVVTGLIAANLAPVADPDRTEAMTQVRKADPDAYEKYQRSGLTAQRINKAAEAPAPKQRHEFMTLAKAIMDRDRVDGMEALRRARVQNPDLWKSYRSS
jgi:hypothetical protein